MTNLYELNVVSQLGEFKGKTFKKYAIDGSNFIGVFGNEPFEIKFTNNSRDNVQVKITLDGTDVLTGKPGDTSPDGEMWMVKAYSTVVLKGFPENHAGGAQFVFTDAAKSVAVHTHGDTSSKGVIAVAVYKESYVSPAPTYRRFDEDTYKTRGFTKGVLSAGPASAAGSAKEYSASINLSDENASASLSVDSLSKSSVGVGAGSFVEQKISHVKGFVAPILSDVITVRFAWFDELQAKLKEKEKNSYQPGKNMPGFPADKPIMSLGSTPRINTRFEETSSTTSAANVSRFF